MLRTWTRSERPGTPGLSVQIERMMRAISTPASAEWCQTAFGEVLDEVVQYRARGVPIAVISEEHWTAALP